MVMVARLGPIMISMKATTNKVRCRVKGFSLGPTTENMTATGTKIECMEKAHSNGRTEKGMLAIIQMTKRAGSDSLRGLTASTIVDNG